jgi:DNA-3-methyladenine glycosylase
VTDARQHSPGTPRDPPAGAPGDAAGPRPVDLAPTADPLPAAFFERPSVELAAALLGTVLVRDLPEGRCSGLIVETEAYAGESDRASHARAGRTRRTAPMFGPGGRAYVYLIYGIHNCLNVVAGEQGQAGAVLIRALAPLSGIAGMRIRRAARANAETRDDTAGVRAGEAGASGGGARPGSRGRDDDRLCAGPGRLCQSMAIDRRLDGHDLTMGHGLWLSAPDVRTAAAIASAGVSAGPRIGVDYAGADWAARPWRFGVRGHPALSRPFPPHPAG